MKIYTLGYQNLNTELYVRSLRNAGVGIVLDVREHAWSQRPAFIKSNLRDSLAESGIDYRHVKDAGNPSKNRKTARSASECLNRYRAYLRANRQCLELLLDEVNAAFERGRPACLTCYERSVKDCHRSVLVDELLKIESNLIPIHLEPTLAVQGKSQKTPQTLMTTSFLAPAFLPFT